MEQEIEISLMPINELEKISDMLKALAHPVRMKILCLLKNEEKNVRELENKLGVSQALVSQQLKILKLNNLVEVSRRQGFSYYCLSPEKKESLLKIMSGICQCFKNQDKSDSQV